MLVGAVLTVAQLFAYTARANAQARRLTVASILAAHQLNELRGRSFGYDGAGARVSAVPLSPAGSLDANTSGFVEFLDEAGRALAGGTVAPPGTAYVRRWAVRPSPVDPADTLVLQVRLLAAAAGAGRAADPAEVSITTLRTRVMW